MERRGKEKSYESGLLTHKQYQITVGLFGITLVAAMNYVLVYLIGIIKG